jgi:uncharacterized membrane protein YkvA (DUF1232 family)
MPSRCAQLIQDRYAAKRRGDEQTPKESPGNNTARDPTLDAESLALRNPAAARRPLREPLFCESPSRACRCSTADVRSHDHAETGNLSVEMLRTFVIVAAVLVAMWLFFLVWVWLIRPDETSLSDATRLLPDTLRLVKRLSTDRAIPRSTRWWTWVLLIYLASPIDLIPDFVPVIGYADDAIITSFVLRHVIARSGRAKLVEHWPGSEAGLSTLTRLLRLRSEA